jgi:hypothetical protein
MRSVQFITVFRSENVLLLTNFCHSCFVGHNGGKFTILHELDDTGCGSVDADLEVLAQDVDPTPSSGGKGGSKRGGNYNHNEGIQLCASWMNITNDSIVGNEQPNKTYWQMIAHYYHANETFDSDRSASSLEHRCGTIQK